jgi:hypothetical protein
MYRGGTSAYVIDSAALGHILQFESRAAIRSLKKPLSTPQSAHCVCVFSSADVIDCPTENINIGEMLSAEFALHWW